MVLSIIVVVRMVVIMMCSLSWVIMFFYVLFEWLYVVVGLLV